MSGVVEDSFASVASVYLSIAAALELVVADIHPSNHACIHGKLLPMR